jgi:hypothetical protein
MGKGKERNHLAKRRGAGVLLESRGVLVAWNDSSNPGK